MAGDPGSGIIVSTVAFSPLYCSGLSVIAAPVPFSRLLVLLESPPIRSPLLSFSVPMLLMLAPAAALLPATMLLTSVTAPQRCISRRPRSG